MANFQPTGQILIGRVPFDNSYQHTMTFSDADAQREFFQSCCSQHLADGTYTYTRMNSAIRVPFNAEALYTYNYVMYQNYNYGSKWFYAFIVGCNYINENTTELVLELDVMQTWYFDYYLRQGFVEREHVENDAIGANLNPEPEAPFNLLVLNEDKQFYAEDMTPVVQTNAIPQFGFDDGFPPLPWNTYKAIGTSPLGGAMYNGIVNGCKYLVFEDLGNHNYGELFDYFLQLNQGGGAESISNVFMIPRHFIKGEIKTDGGYPILEDTYEDGTVYETYYTSRPTTLDDGYVPRNNKLFTYPYCFCRVMDNSGAMTELRYELWHRQAEGYKLQLATAIEADAQCFIYPKAYAGRADNIEQGINFPVTTKGSWTYSAYQTWSAQNSLANSLSFMVNAAMLMNPARVGLGAAVKALGVSAKSIGKAAKAGKSLKGFRVGNALGAAADEAQAAVSKGDMIGAGLGALGLANLAGEVSRNSKIPDVQKGMATGNSLYGAGLMWWSIQQVVIQKEFARIMDNFFDMYGYQVDRVKTPNRTGRQSWNYVKMANACHYGRVPAEDMAQINAIYDAGITFWHTSDVGNYTLPNGIVGA